MSAEQDHSCDLQKSGVNHDAVSSAEFYLASWSYLYNLQAGRDRVDLNGKKCGTVTEQEQMEARERLAEEKRAARDKNGSSDGVMRTLRASGKTTDGTTCRSMLDQQARQPL
jgi:sRNA-binding protein